MKLKDIATITCIHCHYSRPAYMAQCGCRQATLAAIDLGINRIKTWTDGGSAAWRDTQSTTKVITEETSHANRN